MKKKQARSKQRQLFDPDDISTKIHQALSRDFNKAQHEYCLNDTRVLYALNRQVTEFRKKYCDMNHDRESVELETFDKFNQTNEHMRVIGGKISKYYFPDPKTRIQRSTPKMSKIHLRARALMHSVLGSFDHSEWFEECRNSSGTTVGVPFKDTSVERKLTWPISMTNRVKPLFDQYMLYDASLRESVIVYNRQFPLSETIHIVDGSRATTVDKTTTKRRMICVEPTGNMFFQQGLMHMFYSRMSKFGLDVTSLPEVHKELAKLSSISCLNATIDWSSASDCVSIELLRWLLPEEWFEVIMQVRSDRKSVV